MKFLKNDYVSVYTHPALEIIIISVKTQKSRFTFWIKKKEYVHLS